MRTGITSDDGEDGSAPTAAGPSTVIQFSRRAPPQLGFATTDDAPLASSVPIGQLVQAVILKVANKRIRVRVARAGEEDGRREP